MSRIAEVLDRVAASVAAVTATAGLVAILLALWSVDIAQAGRYSLKQCEGSEYSGFSGSYGNLGGVDRVDFVAGCTPSSLAKIGIYQDRSGRTIAYGVGGEFSWSMPPGERVVATELDAKLKNANGIEAELIGREIGAATIPLDGGMAHDGTRRTVKWTDPVRTVSDVFVRLSCRKAGGCANQSSSTKAYLEVFDVDLTVNDFRPPSVTASGTVWGWAGSGDWRRGSAPLGGGALDDGSGIARIWARVNGVALDLGDIACSGARPEFAVSSRPCPSPVERTATVNTTRAPFTEGHNLIAICAADFAGSAVNANQACTANRSLWIDNLPPTEPIGLKPADGDGWRAENRFELTWSNPSGQGSPIDGGRYRILDPGTDEELDGGELETAKAGELGPLTMPGPGEYDVEVRLRDAAGNLGRPARTTVRFDDRPPGDVAPEPPSGWVSADELPLRQVIGKAASGGPSGVRGYALAVSRSAPAAPCPSGLCLEPELALTGGVDDRTGLIPGLADGSHWVSAVAASGAGVASENPGSTLVKVDRSAPSVRLEGAPTGWVNRPVTVTASAADSGSGMVPQSGDDGQPVTVIEAQDHAPYAVSGPTASFTVTTEGVSRVRYWARDLAGNSNDGEPGPEGSFHPPAGEAVVRIDTEPPRLAFDGSRDANDPELIRAKVEDDGSGVGSATISWRRVGSGSRFTPLPTTAADGWFEARIPSDDLAPGSYEIRAEASDRAGNVGEGILKEDGSPMLLELPVKQRLTLKAGFGPRLRPGAKVGPKARASLSGRLTAAGSGISGAPLAIVEDFGIGARPGQRITQAVSDGTGRFAVRLKPGPSRRISVLYAGTRLRSRVVSRPLTLRARSRVSLRISPSRLRNGGWAKMKGRVARRGALMPARGKLVAIQYFDPARAKWRPVEVLRTNRRGGFRYRYRFRTIASAQRIIFRAVSLAEAGWPYLASTSRRRSVIVYPRR